jgi:hypothetical protein
MVGCYDPRDPGTWTATGDGGAVDGASATDGGACSDRPAPEGCSVWTLVDCLGVCYLHCENPRTFTDSGISCVLAELEGEADNTCLRVALPGVEAWIGLQQYASPPPSNPEEGWRWVIGGSFLGYDPWSSDEPNDEDGDESGQEECALWRGGSSGWNDEACSNQFGYLCELAPGPSGTDAAGGG